MTAELTILAWTIVLALVQIVLAAVVATRDQGPGYNMSPRDEAKSVSKLGGRLTRAQHNLFETLPLFAAAILIAHATGRENGMTLLGAELFLGARLVYLPLYALGIPVVRSLCWTIALIGLVMVLIPILHP